MTSFGASPRIDSVRAEITAGIMADTGLNEAMLRALVEHFYDAARRDPVLGPIFDAHITDWPAHIERMIDFWSSIALMTGRYHGRAMAAHTPLALGQAHFDRWLDLFRTSARETCTPAGAVHLVMRAERVARSLQLAVVRARTARDGAPFTRLERMSK
ncbi:group III truncated hemoglobin [Oceaniglobus indicus]|uniref:group III truncated hemoglobin n=1 Tax=Oceaniglobus indicus TaxID=2047749 RepID=UPI000C19FCF3|nr:group III truncated hemoglobin [Oceaniglobus indicus]